MADFDLPDADDFQDTAEDVMDRASDAEDNFGGVSFGSRRRRGRDDGPPLEFCKPGCNMCVM